MAIDHDVTDAATLKPGTVRTLVNIHYDALRDEGDFFAWVWRMVQNRMMHEAAEFFLVDGVRVHDPHKDDARANSLR